MTGSIMLREIKPEDVPMVGKLSRETITTSYAKAYPPRAIEFFLKYHSDNAVLRRINDGVIVAAEMDGEIVGTGSLVESEITGVFVRPGLQGRNIGRLIMDRLESLAREKGIRRIELSVSLVSKGFYEKRGYKITRAASIDVGEGQKLDYWEAEKDL